MPLISLEPCFAGAWPGWHGVERRALSERAAALLLGEGHAYALGNELKRCHLSELPRSSLSVKLVLLDAGGLLGDSAPAKRPWAFAWQPSRWAAIPETQEGLERKATWAIVALEKRGNRSLRAPTVGALIARLVI